MYLTVYKDIRDKATGHVVEVTWARFCELLTTHTRRASKDGRAFSPATFTGDRAVVEGVEWVYALGFDLDKTPDGGPLAHGEAMRYVAGLRDTGLECVFHTTHSHTASQGNWRVFVRISRPITADEYPVVWAGCLARLGIPSGIKTDNAARAWYFPSCPPDGRPAFGRFEGAPLDVDALVREGSGSKTEDRAPMGTFGPASPELLERVRVELKDHGPHVQYQSPDSHTYRACLIACHEYALTPTEAAPVLLEWNKGNQPPWDEDRLLDKLTRLRGEGPRGSARVGFEFLGALGAVDPSDPFVKEVLEAKRDLQAELQASLVIDGVKPMFESALALTTRKYPSTPWLVSGIVPYGGVGVIATEPKSAKTWCATELAVALASGTKAFGEYQTTKGAVAYFYAEDTGRAVGSRLRALLASRQGVPGDLYCQPRGRELDVCDDDSLAVLVASARRLPPLALLILDPLRDVHTGAEDSSDEMSRVMRRLRVLGRVLGTTVLFVHHSAKSSADTSNRRPGQRMRGSSAIHGGCDFGVYLSDLAGDGRHTFVNRVDVEVKSARGAGSFTLTLTIEDGEDDTAVAAAWEVGEVGSGEQDTGDIFDILECLADCEHKGLAPPTVSVVRKQVGGRKEVVAAKLKTAEERGYVKAERSDGVVRGWTLDDQGRKLLSAGGGA